MSLGFGSSSGIGGGVGDGILRLRWWNCKGSSDTCCDHSWGGDACGECSVWELWSFSGDAGTVCEYFSVRRRGLLFVGVEVAVFNIVSGGGSLADGASVVPALVHAMTHLATYEALGRPIRFRSYRLV